MGPACGIRSNFKSGELNEANDRASGLKLVQYPDHGTSASYYVDIIEICHAAKFLNSDEIKRLYLEDIQRN